MLGFDPPLAWLRAKRGVKWRRPGAQVLPAWVADMDFAVCPAVHDAISDLLERGDLGYPDWTSNPLAEPFSERMSTRYGWRPDPGHVRGVTDLIQAVQIVTELCTKPGDGVVAHVPNYPPFLASLATMGRQLVPSPMVTSGTRWSFDAERLEKQVRTDGAKVLLLVNPHNPTGRVLDRYELTQLAEIACRHDLIVISDEIHAELIHGNAEHIPFASLSAEIEARTITITSASKSFNLAGLRAAVAHVGPAWVRDAWDRLPPDLLGATNVIGVEATLAAWRAGDSWLGELRDHLTAQRDHFATQIHTLAGVTLRLPEATYLAWLDCTSTRIAGDPSDFFAEHGHVKLSPGPSFGPGGEGHARLNFATSRPMLDEIIKRMSIALQTAP